MIIKYGPWAPDQPRYGNTCITATNVYPVKNGYGPFQDASTVGSALADGCKGVISFRRVSGELETFAGTETKLYRLIDGAWSDVSNGTYSATDVWRFALYGDRLIATNGFDNPQAFDLDSDTTFADLSGAPKHRFPIVIRDVLVALDVTDGTGFEVKWSAVNDSTDWTTAGGGGSQSFPDGGPVKGGVGDEFGIVLQQHAVIRMNFVGQDLRFTFDKIEGAVGCIEADSIVGVKGRAFYLSGEGFQIFDGVQSMNISDEQVTDTFFSNFVATRELLTDADTSIDDDSDTALLAQLGPSVQGAHDPRNSCVVWRYPLSSGNKLILHNYVLGRWAESDLDVDCLHTNVTSTEETQSVLGGFNSSNVLVRLDGSDRSATVSTGDLQLSDGSSFIRSVRGLVDSAHTITVAKKTAIADSETTTNGSSNANGKVSLRSHGRYHRIQLQPTATFTEIVGVDVESVRTGRRI